MPRLTKSIDPVVQEALVQSNGTISVAAPQTSMSFWILLLIAVVSIFQSYQLMRISSKVVNAPTSTASPSGSAPASGGLESMVGGC